ncbi:MAG: hypothetical protein ACT452_02590 [Microthrixaceae bacterium]
MTGRRRGRGAAALVVALGMSAVLGIPFGAQASAAPVQDCPTPIPGDPCPSTTTEPSTTTTAEVVESSTTTQRPTTTTSRQTTTTRPTQAAATATTTTIISTSNLLVPGDGTEGAQLTTTTEARSRAGGSSGPSDSTLIGLMIFNLLLIATVVGVLTRRYWRATEPPPLPRNPAPHATR